MALSSLIYVFIASLLAATVNFCLSKNAERQKSSMGYLTIYFASSFLISFFVADVSMEHFHFVMPSIGAVAGILNLVMMGLVALAIKKGASGLTFSFQNSASVLPALSLFLIFGSPFGFDMNFTLVLGFFLIIAGLFISSRNPNDKDLQRSFRWFALVIAIFLIQGLILSLFQWRCLLLAEHPQDHPFLPWICEIQEDAWFMPSFFLIPTLLQALMFGVNERRWFSRRELFLGLMGGLLNGGATFFLLLATKTAVSNDKMILFPLFAVSVITLCNLWGKAFFGERIHWPGLLLCIAGVFISSLAAAA